MLGRVSHLGNGDPHEPYTASPVPVAGGHIFTTIVAGGGAHKDYACALDTAGKAWCWGEDGSGELGDGDASGATKYAPVPVAGGHTFITITDQGQAWCGLDPDGQASCRHWFHER